MINKRIKGSKRECIIDNIKKQQQQLSLGLKFFGSPINPQQIRQSWPPLFFSTILFYLNSYSLFLS